MWDKSIISSDSEPYLYDDRKDLQYLMWSSIWQWECLCWSWINLYLSAGTSIQFIPTTLYFMRIRLEHCEETIPWCRSWISEWKLCYSRTWGPGQEEINLHIGTLRAQRDVQTGESEMNKLKNWRYIDLSRIFGRLLGSDIVNLRKGIQSSPL